MLPKLAPVDVVPVPVVSPFNPPLGFVVPPRFDPAAAALAEFNPAFAERAALLTPVEPPFAERIAFPTPFDVAADVPPRPGATAWPLAFTAGLFTFWLVPLALGLVVVCDPFCAVVPAPVMVPAPLFALGVGEVPNPPDIFDRAIERFGRRQFDLAHGHADFRVQFAGDVDAPGIRQLVHAGRLERIFGCDHKSVDSLWLRVESHSRLIQALLND